MFNKDQLRRIAMLLMFLDHFAKVVMLKGDFWRPYFIQFGTIGFLIFALFVCEGFYKTHDLKAYTKRMLIMAMVSELPFQLALNASTLQHNFDQWHLFIHLNVCFTYLVGIWLLDRLENGKDGFRLFYFIAACGMGCFCDRGIEVPVVFMAYFYLHKNPKLQHLCRKIYNGEKGSGQSRSYYLFYPVHFLVLCCLALTPRII